MQYLRLLFSLALVALFSTQMAAQFTADDLLGVWMPSHGKGHIKIEKIGEKYFGKVVWMKEPLDPVTGEKKLDVSNPDPALQKRRRMGLRVLQDFNANGTGYWDAGTIYDPENGKTYSCKITMKDKNTLDIRGFVGVSMFGRTDTWTRVK